MNLWIDAYAHTGVPRFGSAAQGRRFLQAAGIHKIAFVLGPQVPDLEQIPAAHEALGDDVRVFGIPFGRDEAQVCEIVEAQMEAGVLGFRMEPREVLAYPSALRLIGEAGRGVYATNPSGSAQACRVLSDWLETWSSGFVAAPHFLSPRLATAGTPEREAIERLCRHPRFLAILSRHGGMGSTRPYPHDDLLEWVRFALGLCGRDRVAWGSEFPVFLWRNERLTDCLAWLGNLVPTLPPADIEAFLGGNAQRVLFERPRPARGRLRVPSWVEPQFDRGRTVPLFPAGFPLPMPTYRVFLDRYLERLDREPDLGFEDFFREVVAQAARG
jgi:hypothetical protein